MGIKNNFKNFKIPELKEDEPFLPDESIMIAEKLLKQFDKYEIEENSRNKKGETIDGLPCNRGSVLMFVPGLNDIGRVESYLKEEFNQLK